MRFEEEAVACPTSPAELFKEGDAEGRPVVSLCGLPLPLRPAQQV